MQESEEIKTSHESGFRGPKMAVKPRICGYSILSLVLGILSLPFFVLTAMPAVVIGIISIARISYSDGALKGRAIATAGIAFAILWTVTVCLLWFVDAPPISNDYTIADLRSAPAECAESFEILKTLIDERHSLPGAPATGLTKADVDISAEIRGIIEDGNAREISEMLDFHAQDIERTWGNMKKTRGLIKQLNAFDEIADLTGLSVDSEGIHVHVLIELARFYQVYGHLKLQQGDIQAFADDLVELDSVYRKLSVNARWVVTKLACLIAVNENIVTANAIANDSQTSPDTVELLAKHFRALTSDELSMRNGVLSEYLSTKSVLASIASENNLLFKPNSTLRFERNRCDRLLNAGGHLEKSKDKRLSVWPDFYPFDEPDLDRKRVVLSLLYRCYNPRGSQVIDVRRFSNATFYEKSTNIAVQDDLLQIVLNKRLGKQVSLKARAYSDQYIVDIQNKKTFSPGPDGRAGTKDDISLPINPEVLGW